MMMACCAENRTGLQCAPAVLPVFPSAMLIVSPIHDAAAPRRPAPVRPGLFAAALLLTAGVVAAALWTVSWWAQQQALQALRAQAGNASQLTAALLRNNLDKFRALPFVLTQDVDVRAVLQGAPPAQLEKLGDKFNTLRHGVGASTIYLLDATGYTLTSSNWRGADSFAGVDFRFRPYFQIAMRHGSAEHFALGSVSHEPGLYLSQRVDDENGVVLGVVVLKVDFHRLETDWLQAGQPVFVSDEHGVVLIGNVPAWRFNVLAPLGAGLRQEMRRSQQFGDAGFDVLPLQPGLNQDGPDALLRATAAVQPFGPAGLRLLHTAVPLGYIDGWTLHMLTPVDAALANARVKALQGLILALACAAGVGGMLFSRRYQTRRRAAEQAQIQAQLEAQVELRTGQLRQANHRLVAEMDERQRTQERLHGMQEELAQKNKLALLGQVAAGVAHEINQPVAAIRSYADNAVEYLKRSNTVAAHDNLATIAGLTERIGRITAELRAFSRKASTGAEPTCLQDVLEGALMLVAPRVLRQGVALHRPVLDRALLVLADRNRLEQVLVNLLQNALDALEDTELACITLSIEELDHQVRLTVRDNGPGLSPQALARLFTPFSTTKAEGLGLGLVISRDILAEFGAEIQACNASTAVAAPLGQGCKPTDRGAVFTITLRQVARAAPAGFVGKTS